MIKTLLLSAFLLICFCSKAQPNLADSGKQFFIFSNPIAKDKPLKVWYYSPTKNTDSLPIVMMFHGSKRNASAYLDDWINVAKLYNCIVVAPEFSSKDFPKVAKYNLGNVYNAEKSTFNQSNEWTFSIIEPLFDFVKNNTNNVNKDYYMSGHSAGAQFVHRFLFFNTNNRVKRAMISNAGWYTMPDVKIEFPFGIKDSPVDSMHLKDAFGKKVFVVLGESDTDTESPDFNKGPEYDVQGYNRFERGKNYFSFCKKTSLKLNTPFNWTLATVPGVAHSNKEISKFAAALFFMNLP